jgi:hypothetical protein
LYKNNKETIKIKGYNNNNITFNELKDKFYKDELLKINSYFYIKKSNFNLESLFIEKRFNLSNYDKRVFTEDKKNTKPIFFKNFVYYK